MNSVLRSLTRGPIKRVVYLSNPSNKGGIVKKPWLSVVMPTFNGAAFLTDALESIRSQWSDGIEVIAIDDGSTDETLAILNRYTRSLPLQIIERNHIGNWVANTNLGLSQARGEYVCFLHQDDCWLPGRLAELSGCAAAHPEAALLLHPAWYIDAAGKRLGMWSCPLPRARRLLSKSLVIQRLIVQNFIAMPSPLFRRNVALDVGGMDESLWYTADWDFWLKLAANGATFYSPKPLACFRLHSLSQTVRRSILVDDYRAQLETVLERHLRSQASNSALDTIVRRASEFSVEVNTALTACFHGCRPSAGPLVTKFVGLGPAGWYRYLRDSRIVERVSSRLRLRLAKI